MEASTTMDPLIATLIELIVAVLDLFWWVLIIQVVMSWLIAFNVINTRNRFIYMIGDFADRATEPVLRPIRSILPNFGGIDLSPLVVLLLLSFLRNLIIRYALYI
jgi:YggT family protein